MMNSDNFKRKEYLKQQFQLRTMTKSSPALTADDMIENLLSKKEIFQKKSNISGEQSNSTRKQTDPIWLLDGHEPGEYRKIWEQVCTPSGLTDTPSLSNLLLKSGLSTDTLGYIWSLTNTTISGALTKIELYQTLALVALAQKGYTFTNLLLLNQFHEAPIPRLDYGAYVTTNNTSSLSQLTTTTTTLPLTSLSSIDQSMQQLSIEPVSLLDSASGPPPNCSDLDTLSILSATDLNKLNILNLNNQTVPTTVNNGLDDDFDEFKSADIFLTETPPLTVLDANAKDSLISNNDLFKSFDLSNNVPKEKQNTSEPNINENQPNTSSNREDKIFTTHNLLQTLQQEVKLTPTVNTISDNTTENDKYNALRHLANVYETQTINKEDLFDDFGDFVTASQSISDTQATSSTISTAVSSSLNQINEKCLEGCIHILREANDLFKSIEDVEVLQEVVADDRGRRYLEEIVEAERIGRRITSSKLPNSFDNELIKQLDSLCKALEPLIKPLEHTHLEEEKGGKCGLCQCEIGPAHVKYAANQFHAPCANLFIHACGEMLPLKPLTLFKFLV